jgi:hypothetical protein
MVGRSFLHRNPSVARKIGRAKFIVPGCLLLLSAGCANQGPQPNLSLWQSGAGEPSASYGESAAGADRTAAPWTSGNGDAAARVYEYRGGRDPNTGLARVQM